MSKRMSEGDGAEENGPHKTFTNWYVRGEMLYYIGLQHTLCRQVRARKRWGGWVGGWGGG